MGAIRRKSLNDPDALNDLALAEIRIVRIGSQTIGYGVEQPGWGLAFEEQGQRDVKGLDRPIEVYRLA